MLARFVCCIILHLSVIDEVEAGQEMMKYSVNHSDDFVFYQLAFASGWLQSNICYQTEWACIFIILISEAPIAVVSNFVSLAIITQFDDFIYESLKNEVLKKLYQEDIRETLVIRRHTSSHRCPPEELVLPDAWYAGNMQPEDMTKPLRLEFQKRSACNKFLYILYRAQKVYYLSSYFYFFPFISITLSIGLPLLFYNGNENV